MSAVVHQAPPEGDGLTPCCGVTVFELPHGDRLTMEPWAATCAVKSSPVQRVVEDLHRMAAGFRGSGVSGPGPTLFLPRSLFDAMVRPSTASRRRCGTLSTGSGSPTGS